MPDRKLIILVVIVTTSLSFTLGYFVGKKVLKENQPQAQIIAVAPQPEVTPQQQPKEANVQEIPAQGSEVQSVSSPASSVPTKTEQTAEPKSKTEPKEDSLSRNTVIYTVQVGAFKNLNDAEALKNKLVNKGYKAYIKQSTAKDVKVFKVRTGEFTNKKDAEVAAIKIKNLENLKTFVTFKNEEAREKDKNLSNAAKQEKPR